MEMFFNLFHNWCDYYEWVQTNIVDCGIVAMQRIPHSSTDSDELLW